MLLALSINQTSPVDPDCSDFVRQPITAQLIYLQELIDSQHLVNERLTTSAVKLSSIWSFSSAQHALQDMQRP